MKVLHLPSTVGGHAWGLSRGERALGLDSDVLISSRNWLNYPGDIHLNLDTADSNVRKFLLLGKSFFRYRNSYDVYHFNAGSSLIHSPHHGLNQVDLAWYPDTARLFVTYNGCDARQKFPTVQRTKVSACHIPNCYHGMCNYGAYDGLRRKAIGKMALYARHMWALNPDLMHFLPREKASFLPYAISSWNTLPLTLPSSGRVLKLIHAPTNRAAKGTDVIVEVIDKLRVSHPGRFEFTLVENISNDKALALYASADIVIDQILIGWYGGFAVEAMKMGKPVIARIASEDLEFVPRQMAKDVLDTVINADPLSLLAVLTHCLEDDVFLKERAAASVEYVLKWHDPKYVATLTKERYEAA